MRTETPGQHPSPSQPSTPCSTVAHDKYLIVNNGQAIECLRCHAVSHNRNDVLHRYCGRCKSFHDDVDASAIASMVSTMLAGRPR